MGSSRDFVYERAACDEAARVIYGQMTAAIKTALVRLGLEPVFEDSTGVFAIRVADERNLGTAYLEIRDCAAGMRIVLFEESPDGGASY